jgi:hypothetical protein
MLKGIIILFIMPITICISCLLFWDYFRRIKKYKKNQKDE